MDTHKPTNPKTRLLTVFLLAASGSSSLHGQVEPDKPQFLQMPQERNKVDLCHYDGDFISGADERLIMVSTVTTDFEGNIVAIDEGWNRVQILDNEGNTKVLFGASGISPGQLRRPQGGAVDHLGRLWIADSNNDRIQVFNSNGEFLFTFGEEGTEEGQLDSPYAIVFDPQGNAIVADSRNDRIQVFDSEGRFLRSFGVSGSKPGEFGFIIGLDIDDAGNLWIADWSNKRIEVYTTDGDYVRTVELPMNQDDSTVDLHALSIAPSGIVYVLSDNGAEPQIHLFDLEGQFLREWNYSRDLAERFESEANSFVPVDIHVTGDERVLLANRATSGGVEVYAQDGVLTHIIRGSLKDGQLHAPVDVALGPNGDIAVADAALNNIQVFDPEGDFRYGFVVRDLVDSGGDLSVAFSPDGSLIVADGANHRIRKYNASGQITLEFGAPGRELGRLGELRWPRDVIVDRFGAIIVADSGNERVQIFDPMGKFVRAIGPEFAPLSEFRGVDGVAMDPMGNIIAADHSSRQIVVFNFQGRLIRRLGSIGSGLGEFGSPTDVATDRLGHILVTDRGHHRMQVFSAAGEFLRVFGSEGVRDQRSGGAGPGEFNLPGGLVTDNSGNIYIADERNQRIQRWSLCLCEAMSGDVNCDGTIDLVDHAMVEAHLEGNPLSPEQQERADVDGNGTIDMHDLHAINSVAKNLETSDQGLRITQLANELMVEFFGGQLFQSNEITGPFEEVVNATSPLRIERPMNEIYFQIR